MEPKRDNQDTIESPIEEPEEMDLPTPKEDGTLAESERRERDHRREASLLGRAFGQAGIRAWFWAANTRRTRYLPSPGGAVEPLGDAAGETTFHEDRLLQVQHPDDRERVGLAWSHAHESHEPYEIDYRVINEQGIVRHQHETATPEFDENGCYLGHVGVTQDITNQKTVESALQQNSHLLNEAERIASLGHWQFDDDGERMIHCSEQVSTIFGVSMNEFLLRSQSHSSFLQLVHEDDRSFVDDAIRSFYRRFKMDPEATAPLELEYRILRPDGEVRYVRERAGSVANESGQVSRSVGTIQYITEVLRVEREVRIRDAQLRAILENSPIEIVLKDTEGRIIAISQNVGEALGYTTEQMLGGSTKDFLPSHIANVYMEADKQVVETGKYFQEEVLEEIDGKVRYSLSQKFPMRDEQGRISGICSLTTDITEIKEAEARLAQTQKMEALGQLTGGVAHDFNNLLAVIQGNAELISMRVEGDDDLIQAILRASSRGSELTQRLLSFSRRQPLRPQAVDLAALARGLMPMLERTLGETVEVETIATGNLAHAMVDAGQMENALLNLALNARDAMPDGGKLTVGCRNARLDEAYMARNPEAVAGHYAVLAVSDTGTGMPVEVQAHAFEPFFTTKEVGQGSGLGLSMVYGFVKQSGGYVIIDSEEGQGTTVKLYLPRAEELSPPTEDGQLAHIPQSRGEMILVVEDDDDVRALTARLLMDLGYRVIQASEAASAERALAGEALVDLVLSDVVLPGGTNGFDFAKHVGAIYPNLKIIFMSGYSSEAVKPSGVLSPGSVILNKPFRRYELAKALRRALD